MSKYRRDKGIVLMIAMGFLALFTTATLFYLNLSTSDFKITKKSTYSSKAFMLAESGIQKALYELRRPGNFEVYKSEGPVAIAGYPNNGEYEVNVAGQAGADKTVVATGYYLHSTGSQAYARKRIQAVITHPESAPPGGFFGNALLAGDTVVLKGQSYDIDGNIKYGDSINPANTPGSAPLGFEFPMLNFEALKLLATQQVKANGQNNLYTAANVASGKPYPASFWFQNNDGIDNDNDGFIDEANEVIGGPPNIIYMETDLTLNGNIPPMGGFYVVAGDVLTDPDDVVADTTINGNGTIDGCVYTLGNFRIKGGGGQLNIAGGVWGRNEIRLNGNASITFNQTYQEAISLMNLEVKPALKSWEEI